MKGAGEIFPVGQQDGLNARQHLTLQETIVVVFG